MNTNHIKTALCLVRALPQSGLAGRAVTDATSAVRTVVGQLTHCTVVDDPVPAAFTLDDLDALDARLKRLPDTCIGITPSSMENTVSRFRRALRAVGAPFQDGRGQLPLTTPWRELLENLEETDRKTLLPLAHWMSDHGVEPRP